MEAKFIHHVPQRRYSKASVVGKTIFLAGEDSKEPATEKVIGDNAEEQLEITFANMKATLESLGSSMNNVIKTVVYLKEPRDRQTYRTLVRKHFPHAPPSTLIMGVYLAEPEMLVEIDAIAIIPE
jgi:2-iminobutanoate/2-iminopropanoate deaminase